MYLKSKDIEKAAKRAANKTRQDLKRKRLEYIKAKLHEKIPKSEIWFRELYFEKNLNKHTDQFNEIIGPYIADIINECYMYVIEIDGGIHKMSAQCRKDYNKTKYLQQQGFKVFRVKAFCKDAFNNFCESYEKYIQERLSE